MIWGDTNLFLIRRRTTGSWKISYPESPPAAFGSKRKGFEIRSLALRRFGGKESKHSFQKKKFSK